MRVRYLEWIVEFWTNPGPIEHVFIHVYLASLKHETRLMAAASGASVRLVEVIGRCNVEVAGLAEADSWEVLGWLLAFPAEEQLIARHMHDIVALILHQVGLCWLSKVFSLRKGLFTKILLRILLEITKAIRLLLCIIRLIILFFLLKLLICFILPMRLDEIFKYFLLRVIDKFSFARFSLKKDRSFVK